MHQGLEHAADRFGDRDAVRAGAEQWSFRELDGLSNAFARHLTGRGVDAGDRVAVMMANRVEFVVAVHAISKLGAAAVLLSPAWKTVEVGHAVELTGPVHAVADGEATAVLGERLGSEHVTDLDDRGRAGRRARRRPRPVAVRQRAGHRRVGARVQLGHDGSPEGGAPHARVDGTCDAPLGADARSRPRRPVPGGHAPVAHPRPPEPARRGGGGRDRAPAPRGSTWTRCCTGSRRSA